MTVHVPDDRATTLRLADVLGSAGFHQAGLQVLLEDAMRSVDNDDVAELLRRTKSADQLPVLARLFLTDVGAPIAAAASALRPLPLADLVAAGFLTVDGERVRGCVRLRPVRLAGSDLIVASDRTAGGLSSEHVLGITGAGATLADITYRRRVARALDVGTGCGLQALGAAVHARDVVATDTNPRALAFTALNATLNDVVVETRLGDLLAPVSGEFDLIVSNPPFVISPESRYAYRDSGEPGDALCERLVRELPTRLASDGTAHLLLNWAVRAGESACDRPLSWLDGSVDALLLHREPEPVADYASRWLRQTPEGRSPSYPASYEHWLDSFAALGMDAVCFGALALHKTPGRPGVVRGQLLATGRPLPGGPVWAAWFDRTQALTGDVFDLTLALSDDVTLVRRARAEGRAWVSVSTRLEQSGALGAVGDVDESAARVLAACDGRRTLRQVLEEEAGVRAGDIDTLRAYEAPLRLLVEQGVLVPAGNG